MDEYWLSTNYEHAIYYHKGTARLPSMPQLEHMAIEHQGSAIWLVGNHMHLSVIKEN